MITNKMKEIKLSLSEENMIQYFKESQGSKWKAHKHAKQSEIEEDTKITNN